MSPGEQILGELIDSLGGLVDLFFTTLFTTFVSPLLTMVASLLGISSS